MPLIRLDEEVKKEENPSLEKQAKENIEKAKISRKNKAKKYYPLIYICMCVVFFGLGLLVIALINYGLGNGFVI